MADGDASHPKSTAQNPNFVSDYFRSSRLHFIGSFRARYEPMLACVAQRLGKRAADLLRPQVEHLNHKRERVIVHVDMDAFFASVAIRDNPKLRGRPVAVCHAASEDHSASGTARGGEISSCNYEARAYGVRAGMFLNSAKKLCPNLAATAYDFAAYERVSVIIYSLFYSLENITVQAQSVDEAYLELTHCPSLSAGASSCNVEEIVHRLRENIYKQTGCRASAGIGSSKLIARLATTKAKPNGQLRIHTENVADFLSGMRVDDLPGIGWRTTAKFSELGINTCAELQQIALKDLQELFGDQTGQAYYNLCRGIDSTPIEPLKPRKSIGAEVSWAVRFDHKDSEKVERFVTAMAHEVATRCRSAGAVGRKLVYKAYKMKPSTERAHKYLGHGPCEIFNKSCKLDSCSEVMFPDVLAKACLTLHASLHIPNEKFRGVGILVGDLIFQAIEQYTGRGRLSRSRENIEGFFTAEPKSISHDHRFEDVAHRSDVLWNLSKDQEVSLQRLPSRPDERKRDREMSPSILRKSSSGLQNQCSEGESNLELNRWDVSSRKRIRTEVRAEECEAVKAPNCRRRDHHSNDMPAKTDSCALLRNTLEMLPEQAGDLPLKSDLSAVEEPQLSEVNLQAISSHQSKLHSSHRSESNNPCNTTDTKGAHLLEDGALFNACNFEKSHSADVLCRDCDNVMRKGSDGPVDEIFTDPTSNHERTSIAKLDNVRPEMEDLRPIDSEVQPCIGGNSESNFEDVDGLSLAEIPSNWDREVFLSLPKSIQQELISREAALHVTARSGVENASSHVNDTAIPNARNHEKTAHRGSFWRERKRAQLTMTQLAVFTKVKPSTCAKISAEERKPRNLPDCVERSVDRNGQGKTVKGRGVNLRRHSHTNVVGGAKNVSLGQQHGAGSDFESSDRESDLDIPSPPSLNVATDVNEQEKSFSSSKCDQNCPPDGGVLTQLEIEQALSGFRVFETDDLPMLAGKLFQWMKMTSSHVRSAHVELLRSRLLEMARRRELSRLYSELSTIRRFSETIGRDWIYGFNAILRDVQDEVKLILSVPLKIAPVSRHD